jgi:hypothetical protein
MEECSRFLLSLLFILADISLGDDRTHLQYVETLRTQLGPEATKRLLKKEYQKAYFKNIGDQLAKEMAELKTGLNRYYV